jgi:hypothetical protein
MSSSPDQEQQEEALLRSLTEGERRKRRKAVRAVARSKAVSERLLTALVELLRCPDLKLREETARALVHISQPCVGALVAALSTEDEDFRKAVVVTLALMGPAAREAVPVLQGLVEEEEIGPWAARAMVRIESRQGWKRWLRASWPWLMVGCLALGGALIAALLVHIGASVHLSPVVLGAGSALGGLGVIMGLLVGGHGGGARRALLLASVFGVGGAAAGLLLSWILTTLVQPVVQALGG